jgi:hypothetical protein
MLNGWPKEDAKIFSDKAWAALMYESMAEAFRQGNLGVKTVFLEHQLFIEPWPVSLSGIPAGKVFVWQGAEDKTCRVDNAYRIARWFVPKLLKFMFEVGLVFFEKRPSLGGEPKRDKMNTRP